MSDLEHVKGAVSRETSMDWELDCTERNLTPRTIIEYVCFMLGCTGANSTLWLFHKGRRFNIKIEVREGEGMSEFVEIRFKLYRSDRRLLERICEQADGANKNLASRFLMRHWFEIERRQNLPQLGQTCQPPLGQNQPNSEDDLAAALDDLEAAFE